MRVKLVNPASLPKPRGYAHAAIGTGRTVHLAGQIGCDGAGRIESDDLVEQFAKALDNMLDALHAAGGGAGDLAALRIYTTDVAEYRARTKELGVVWRARFGAHYPAMALVGAAALFDPRARVEIEGTAHVA